MGDNRDKDKSDSDIDINISALQENGIEPVQMLFI